MDIGYTAYKVSTPNLVKKKMQDLLSQQDEDLELKDELHITICLGDIVKKMESKKAKNLDFQNIMKASVTTNTNKDNIFEITAIGVNPDTGVIAFKTNSVEGQNDLISDNSNPHITAYVPEGEKAFSSNKITEWETLETPIQFKAVASYYLKDETTAPIKYTVKDDVFSVQVQENATKNKAASPK